MPLIASKTDCLDSSGTSKDISIFVLILAASSEFDNTPDIPPPAAKPPITEVISDPKLLTLSPACSASFATFDSSVLMFLRELPSSADFKAILSLSTSILDPSAALPILSIAVSSCLIDALPDLIALVSPTPKASAKWSTSVPVAANKVCNCFVLLSSCCCS
ncbi:hypothetical protein D3C81_747030 [compost metagenome]